MNKSSTSGTGVYYIISHLFLLSAASVKSHHQAWLSAEEFKFKAKKLNELVCCRINIDETKYIQSANRMI